MTQTIVKARCAEELLALVAHTLGFWPSGSLVLVSLRGPRRRSGLVVRADLPEAAGGRPGTPADELPDLVPHLVSALVADGASSAFLVLFPLAGEQPRAGVGRPHRRLLRVVRRSLEANGLGLAEAVLVAEGRLYDLVCRQACCPPGGRALDDVAASVVGAQMVAAGSSVAPDRSSAVARHLAEVAPVAAGELAVVARALDGSVPREPGPRGQLEAVGHWCGLLDRLLAGATAHDALTPGRAARLLLDLQDVLVRDAVLASAVPGGRDALREAHGTPGAPGDAEQVAGRLLAATSAVAGARSAGDPEVLDAARALVVRAARLAPPHLRAQPLAVLAYWGWWRGGTVEAVAFAGEALQSDPDHTLSQLVVQLAGRLVPPDWVGRR